MLTDRVLELVQLNGGNDGLNMVIPIDQYSALANARNNILIPQASVLKLTDAIKAFQDDLAFLGVDDRVLGMTFSEFGRRIKSNANGGTDHGAAAPLFVFGKKVNPGVIGSNPALSAAATVNDNIPLQFDFRSLYATVLKNWFNAPQTELTAVLLNSFSPVPLIQTATGVAAAQTTPTAFSLSQNFPNPFNPATQFQFSITAMQFVSIKVYDIVGREVATVVNETMAPGTYIAAWNGANFPSGVYYYRLETGSYTEVKKMVLEK